LFLFLALYTVYFFLFKFIVKRFSFLSDREVNKWRIKDIGIYIIMVALFLLCMRGRVSFKAPIQEGTAFISEYMFINELGLNPVYTLYNSMDNERFSGIQLMDDSTAIKKVQENMNIKGNNESPIARQIVCTGEPKRMNVVVVIMESMCTFKMGDYGGPNLILHHNLIV
jgi:hypothetical protein